MYPNVPIKNLSDNSYYENTEYFKKHNSSYIPVIWDTLIYEYKWPDEPATLNFQLASRNKWD